MSDTEMTSYAAGYRCGRQIAAFCPDVTYLDVASNALLANLRPDLAHDDSESRWGIIDALADARREMAGLIPKQADASSLSIGTGTRR